jgi:hypothetical protein
MGAVGRGCGAGGALEIVDGLGELVAGRGGAAERLGVDVWRRGDGAGPGGCEVSENLSDERQRGDHLECLSAGPAGSSE